MPATAPSAAAAAAPSLAVPPPLPLGLTPDSLRTAKGAELKLWAKVANESRTADTRIKLSMKVEEKRLALARHFGFDISVSAPSRTATVETLDQNILDRGMASFVALGRRWDACIAQNVPFKLVRQKQATTYTNEQHILSVLREADVVGADAGTGHGLPVPSFAGPTTSASLPPAAPSDAWPANPIFASFPPPAAPSDAWPAAAVFALPSPISAPAPAAVSLPPILPPPPVVATPNAAPSLFGGLTAPVMRMPLCEDLPTCITQCESGIIAEIKQKYGPSHGKPAAPNWQDDFANHVSKRERVMRVLTDDFGGDKTKFFEFFKAPPPTKKRKSASGRYRPYRGVSEAKKWCRDDVNAEKLKPEFLDEYGVFSELLWNQKWSGMNEWEIWRSMGRERYDRR